MSVLTKNFLMLEDTSSAAALELERGTLRLWWRMLCVAARRLRHACVFGSTAKACCLLFGRAMWSKSQSCSLEGPPGEIVLALRDGRLFLHRFVALRTPNGFELRGDSMPGADPRFPR